MELVANRVSDGCRCWECSALDFCVLLYVALSRGIIAPDGRIIVERRIGNDLKGSDRWLLSQHSATGTEKHDEKLVIIAGVSAGIRTEYLPNTSPECCLIMKA
jgi:hypothetical protein